MYASSFVWEYSSSFILPFVCIWDYFVVECRVGILLRVPVSGNVPRPFSVAAV